MLVEKVLDALAIKWSTSFNKLEVGHFNHNRRENTKLAFKASVFIRAFETLAVCFPFGHTQRFQPLVLNKPYTIVQVTWILQGKIGVKLLQFILAIFLDFNMLGKLHNFSVPLQIMKRDVARVKTYFKTFVRVLFGAHFWTYTVCIKPIKMSVLKGCWECVNLPSLF